MAPDPKRQRTRLSIKQKQDVLDCLKRRQTQVEIADVFSVDQSTISKIATNQKQKLSEACDAGFSLSRKTLRKSDFAILDKLVYAWFLEARTRFLPITGDIIQEKALKFAEKCGIKFSASPGWLTNFKNRYDITFKIANTEEDAVNPETILQWKSRIDSLIDQYPLELIYNMDETALFYYAFPDRSFVRRGEHGSSWKSIKNRFTLIFCTNATGSHKIKLTLLHSAAKPRDFKKISMQNLPVKWQKTNKGWNNAWFCEKWLEEFNDTMISRNSKALLLLDNATCHPKIKLSNVELVFLPPQTTSKLQPLDGGVIRSFKANYRKLYLSRVLDVMPRVNNMAELKKNIPLTSIVNFIASAREQVTSDTIRNCFRKCFIGQSADAAPNNNNSTEHDVAVLTDQLDSSATADEYILVDGEEQIVECVAEEQLIDYVYESVVGNNDETAEVDEDDIEVLHENSTVEQVITADDALKACRLVQTYVAANAECTSRMLFVEKELVAEIESLKKQAKITDFFTSSSHIRPNK